MAEYDNPLDAARRRMVLQTTGQSFFPAVNQRMFGERDDLLKDIDAAFYGGGNAPPAPTPTPTPTPRPRSFGGFSRPIPQLPPGVGQAGPPLAPPYLNRNLPSYPQMGFGLGLNMLPALQASTPNSTPTFSFGMNRNNPWEEWQQKYGFGF